MPPPPGRSVLAKVFDPLVDVDAERAADIRHHQIAPPVAVEVATGDFQRRTVVGRGQDDWRPEGQVAGARQEFHHTDPVVRVRQEQVAPAVAIQVRRVRPVAQRAECLDREDGHRRVEGAVAIAGEDLDGRLAQEHDVLEAVGVEVGNDQRHRTDVDRVGAGERAVGAPDCHDHVAAILRTEGARAGDEIGDAVLVDVGGPDVEEQVGIACDVEGGTRDVLRLRRGCQPGHYHRDQRDAHEFQTPTCTHGDIP